MRSRVQVLHGVNLDMLGRREGEHYGTLTLMEVELAVKRFAGELGLVEPFFFQTNHEGEYCEALHSAGEMADALIVNPGAWTHYSWAIRDALALAGVPAVEVHLSTVSQREQWRRLSVVRDLCVGTVEGKGVEGYREGLALLKAELER
ncbi:MAG: 3-dehydroquinate dehydratase [Thermoleophilaceae bacterium]|nr:3-dehydroquinate dehydratase [Thermoleophilaceae bacterium]